MYLDMLFYRRMSNIVIPYMLQQTFPFTLKNSSADTWVVNWSFLFTALSDFHIEHRTSLNRSDISTTILEVLLLQTLHWVLQNSCYRLLMNYVDKILGKMLNFTECHYEKIT